MTETKPRQNTGNHPDPLADVMAKCTPGPWVIYGGPRGHWDRIISTTTYDTVAAIREPSNKAHTVEDAEREEANAHLISAAPDLYAALEHILAGALSLPRFVEEEGRAALRKARGEQ